MEENEPRWILFTDDIKMKIRDECFNDYKKVLEKIVSQAGRQDEYKKKIYEKIGCPLELMPPQLDRQTVMDSLSFTDWLHAAYSINIVSNDQGQVMINSDGIDFMRKYLRGEIVLSD